MILCENCSIVYQNREWHNQVDKKRSCSPACQRVILIDLTREREIYVNLHCFQLKPQTSPLQLGRVRLMNICAIFGTKQITWASMNEVARLLKRCDVCLLQTYGIVVK